MSRIKDMVRAGMSDTRKTGEALKKVVSKMSSTNALAKAERGEKSAEQHKADWKASAPFKSASEAIKHPSFSKMHTARRKEKAQRRMYEKAMDRGRELNKRDGFTEMAKSPN